MSKIPVIAIFDVGKTNKKLLLFDEHYKIVYEETRQLKETRDEDDFPCEDVHALTAWIKDSFNSLLNDDRYDIKGVNFSAYGATFVFLDEKLKVFLPIYNYLKPYPAGVRKKFYDTYGGENYMAKETASPDLGNLNSGMQLYRLKYEKPEVFIKIKYALHLPQYLSFILTGNIVSDITSIGCHTNMWDFKKNKYHSWLKKESIDTKLAPIKKGDSIMGKINKNIPVGIGLHDSSAALIPYIISFSEPFILLSTGTWCITLNPFNHTPLSDDELQQDCLCYLSYQGKPVKASRLFAGYEHEVETKRLAGHFKKSVDHYKTVQFDLQLLNKSEAVNNSPGKIPGGIIPASVFSNRDLNMFTSYEAAYHQFIADLIVQQIQSINLVLKKTSIKRIFVDGGFSKNQIYMHLLAMSLPQLEVYAASIPQATALGAAMAIHKHWNSRPMPTDIFELKLYSVNDEVAFSVH